MFGLSKKEVISDEIMKWSKQEKTRFRREMKELLDSITEEQAQDGQYFFEQMTAIRAHYLNAVCDDVMKAFNVRMPNVVSNMKYFFEHSEQLGFDINEAEGTAAGKLYAICYASISGKEADPRDCITMNHKQSACMDEVMQELRQMGYN